MTIIDPNKKIQKVRTKQEMRKALSNFCQRKHTMTVPPQDYDDDIILGDAITELLEARETLKTLDTTDFEKLSEEQKQAVQDFQFRVFDIINTNLEPFYKEHPELIFQWHLALNAFPRKDSKLEIKEL